MENSKTAIESAIQLGFDCEIDLWVDNNEHLLLGHDKPEFPILPQWLENFKNNLWVHCKNIFALDFLIKGNKNVNFFWHQNDLNTLTSHLYIWGFAGQEITSQSIVVLPELSIDLNFEELYRSAGICTDFPVKYASFTH